jgi:hypothetical protein
MKKSCDEHVAELIIVLEPDTYLIKLAYHVLY